MESFSSDLTQLENELYEKVKVIKKHLHETKYNPKRVEPGIRFELEIESKWSKFVGETLFINQTLLLDVNYRNAIFWREALLLFVPKQMRENWWVRLIANAYPLSVKLSNIEHEQWEKLWKESSPDLTDYIQNCKMLISSAGSLGLIEVLKQGLFQTLHQYEDSLKRGSKSRQINDLDPLEMTIILSNVFQKSVSISEKAIDVLKIALLKQTIKPIEIGKNLSVHRSTIAKIVKKLLDMNFLRHWYLVDYYALGLTQYMVLLICTKKQKTIYREPKDNPYFFAQKVNCLNTCVITQHYIGPKTKEFYNLLISYCQGLKEKNSIVEFQVFELHPSYRSYQLKYFNTKTKSLDFNINDAVIESDLFDYDFFELNDDHKRTLDNIVVQTEIGKCEQENIDDLDVEILNQFMQGNYNRRTIQKNIMKDMNVISQRIKKMLENHLIFNNVRVVMPGSNGEITAFIEIDSNKRSDIYKNLRERIIRFSYYLPQIYCSNIKGTFNGLMLLAELPLEITMGLAEILNRLLSNSINTKIIVGRPELQFARSKLDKTRWSNGQWIVSKDDFSL
ncbi:MAG: hypothetical protein FK732_11785 [Asgard group archaeon]|nr:hypothetical protein [Asgard group archaeon]